MSGLPRESPTGGPAPADSGRPRRRAWLWTVGLVGLATVVVAVALVSLRDKAPQVGAAVVVTPTGGFHLLDENNSPSVAVDPTDPNRMVIAQRVDRPTFGGALEWSGDGGRSWQPTALGLPAGRDRPFAPDVAFGPDGTLYVSYVNLTGPGNVPDALWVASSSDGGRSLSPPVQMAGRLAFQARVAVDHGGRVHVTWLQAAEVGLLTLAGPPGAIVAASSTDGARTFTSPVKVSDAARPRVGAASPVVDSSGDLVVLYEDFKEDRRDFENLEGPPWDEPLSLVVTRSVDGGRSFSKGVEVETGVVASRRFLVYLPEFPSIAAGPDRSLDVVWADGRNGDDDVFLRRSPDGVTWAGPPVRVNDNRQGDGTSQYLPRVAVAPGGRVDVVFFDRRADPGNRRNETFLAFSSDRARSFTNIRVSTVPSDSQIGSSVSGYAGALAPDLGSRLGVASWNGGAFAVWTDTHLGTLDTGRQDIAAARLSLP